MKPSLDHLCRLSAITTLPSAARHHGGFSPLEEAEADRPPRRATRPASVLPKWCGAVAVLACVGWLPMVCAAQEVAPEPGASSPVPSGAWSPEGQQLFVVVLLLAAALILMERFCAWRLRVRRHQAMAASQVVLDALPSAASGSPATRRRGRVQRSSTV